MRVYIELAKSNLAQLQKETVNATGTIDLTAVEDVIDCYSVKVRIS